MVTNPVKDIWSPHWQIAHIIEDIQIIFCSFSSLAIRHVYRKANKAPDWIGNVGHLVDS